MPFLFVMRLKEGVGVCVGGGGVMESVFVNNSEVLHSTDLKKHPYLFYIPGNPHFPAKYIYFLVILILWEKTELSMFTFQKNQSENCVETFASGLVVGSEFITPLNTDCRGMMFT